MSRNGTRSWAMAVPYKFIGFGAMAVTKPYEFIGFGAMDATKPYEFIGFGAFRCVLQQFSSRSGGVLGPSPESGLSTTGNRRKRKCRFLFSVFFVVVVSSPVCGHSIIYWVPEGSLAGFLWVRF